MGKAQRDAHAAAVKSLLEMADTFKAAGRDLCLEDKLPYHRANKDALKALDIIRKHLFTYSDARDITGAQAAE